MNQAQLTALRKIVGETTITEIVHTRVGYEIRQNGKLRGICLTYQGAIEFASFL